MREFYFETLGDYWKPNNRLIWDGYKDLPFPFRKLVTPSLKMEVTWSVDELISYFRTWSATQMFIDRNDADPTPALKEKLARHWGATEKRTLSWNLTFLVGEV